MSEKMDRVATGSVAEIKAPAHTKSVTSQHAEIQDQQQSISSCDMLTDAIDYAAEPLQLLRLMLLLSSKQTLSLSLL